jgi:hypothetical protein
VNSINLYLWHGAGELRLFICYLFVLNLYFKNLQFMLYLLCFTAVSYIFDGELSGMGNPTGLKSPVGDGDGEKLSPRAGTGTGSGEF